MAEGQWIGEFSVSPELETELAGCITRHSASVLQHIGPHQYVIESILPLKTVYLVGGGHVSMAIANLAQQIDFRTVVIDDRPEFANSERFPSVDELLVCPQYSNLFDHFKINRDGYIIIVTRGHRFDKEVLGQALLTEAGYIGMLGSYKKRDTIYQELLEEGFSSDQLRRVRCPIGLSIRAETVGEIAISIAAQLVEHRACQDNDD